jgi:aspartate aminotransferase
VNSIQTQQALKVSDMAENLIGSEIIKLGGEIRDLIAKGNKIYNFTIGDFDPNIFSIPAELKQQIIDAYQHDMTNYPPANGLVELRKAVVHGVKKHQGLDYDTEEILIAGGARPIIYAIFRTIVDPNDKVLFPVPSWNNNHYTHLTFAQQVMIETLPENKFMPTVDDIMPHIQEATLLALCSPLNPTGTVFTEEGLAAICDAVLAENQRRSPDQKPLYVMYDQIYSMLTFEGVKHVDPVSLRPDMRPYTIFVDGISKSLAATGVRVGWAFGPMDVIDKMKSILGHVGAWAPRAEQFASAQFLSNEKPYEDFIAHMNNEVSARLSGFHAGIQALKNQGFSVDSIVPEGAIYLTVQFDLKGKSRRNGLVMNTTRDISAFLLEEAQVALVPFSAFGASSESTWFRLSVGTTTMRDVEQALQSIEQALITLKD